MARGFAAGLVVALSVSALGVGAAARVRMPGAANPAARPKTTRRTDAPRIIGVIRYDTGANNAGFFPATSGINVGNRFNSDMGAPLLMTDSITGLTFYPRAATAYLTVFGPPNAGGTASNLGSILFTGLAPGAWNSALAGPIHIGPDFLVGAWLNSGSVDIGMDNMTLSGQGFHAFQLVTHFPGAGTGFQAVPNRNALIRVKHPVIPVELMTFTLE